MNRHDRIEDLKTANIGLMAELTKARAECVQLRAALEQQASTIRSDTKLIADLRRALDQTLTELALAQDAAPRRAAG